MNTTGAAFKITISNGTTTLATFVAQPAERFSTGGSFNIEPAEPIEVNCPATGIIVTVTNRNAADTLDVSATSLTLTVLYAWG